MMADHIWHMGSSTDGQLLLTRTTSGLVYLAAVLYLALLGGISATRLSEVTAAQSLGSLGTAGAVFRVLVCRSHSGGT